MQVTECLARLGVNLEDHATGSLIVRSPIDGRTLAQLGVDDETTIAAKVASAQQAFKVWRSTPPPVRGELIRLLGEELRTAKSDLGELVSMECGKIREEGLGEVQEMIDICDFAVGLSRQLYGLTIASERPGHKMRETWQPLGPIGVITAFNFPVAVWSWNTAIAIVCGDSVVWKPSEKAPLCALACASLLRKAAARMQAIPEHLLSVVLGQREAGQQLADDHRLKLISATGSCAMGRSLGPRVSRRFGRVLLELGGNNAIIVAPSADLSLALPGIVFGSVGTAGQRCTTTRRLFVHGSIYDHLLQKLKTAYASVTIGDPLRSGTLVGPLIDEPACSAMQTALQQARESGATVTGGKRVLQEQYPHAYYVEPAIVEFPDVGANSREEHFAPILYVFKYHELEDAIARQNDVPQGLSSAIFTNNLREAEEFTSECGSDCGFANVNIGTSGAEIGGAFGGEKDTGGGREAGSDAWRSYMRRSTSTVNYSRELPLAQGIKFDIES